jgi:hypothetical protein
VELSLDKLTTGQRNHLKPVSLFELPDTWQNLLMDVNKAGKPLRILAWAQSTAT